MSVLRQQGHTHTHTHIHTDTDKSKTIVEAIFIIRISQFFLAFPHTECQLLLTPAGKEPENFPLPLLRTFMSATITSGILHDFSDTMVGDQVCFSPHTRH